MVDTVNGTAGNDVIDAAWPGPPPRTPANEEIINGLAGNDQIFGLGANDTLNGGAGDDTLTGGDGSDTLVGGDGFDIFRGGIGNDTFHGANNGSVESGPPQRFQGGRADYSTADVTGSIAVNFAATQTVTGNATVGVDTLINVQQVRGTNSNDTFTVGAGFSTQLFDDFAEFEGRDGNDTITGNGRTRISYQTAAAGVTVNIDAGTGQSTAAGDPANVGVDNFTGVNGVRGSAHADVITAANASGQFQFIGLAGNDTIIGTMEGINSVDFNNARYDSGNPTAGIAVTMGTGTVAGGVTSSVVGNASIGTDTLINVEGVRGTDFADTYTVNGAFLGQFGKFNSFQGMDGNDTITGNGATRIDYGVASAAVTINLQTGTAQGTAAGDVAQVGVDTFTAVNQARGSDYNDTIIGSNGAQAERLAGLDGNDSINGGGGTLDSADYLGALAAVTVNLATGTAQSTAGGDLAEVGVDTLTNIEGVRGSEFGDTITGNAVANILGGQNGNDNIHGGGGADIIIGDDLPPALDPYSGAFGTSVPVDSGNDLLFGEADNDTLRGGLGNDALDGGTGVDAMFGGLGDDTYTVDNFLDAITEAVGEGANDRVLASATYTLAAGRQIEQLNTTNSAGVTAIDLTGNEFNSSMQGNNGANTLDGRGGIDTMLGFGGNDIYIVDNVSDRAIEAVGGGVDVVRASVNFVLEAGREVERLETTSAAGTAAIRLTGNEFANIIQGNAGANILNGVGGIDTMTGFAGNDWYFVDNGSDQAIEAAGGGTADRVFTSVSYTLAAELEQLSTTSGGGTSVINLTGNGLNNIITGNAAANLLNGGAGFDTMFGLAGNDTFFVDNVGDRAIEAAGGGTADQVLTSVNFLLEVGSQVEFLSTSSDAGVTAINLTGNALANTVKGNAGNNFVNGGAGIDTLIGLGGLDNFLFNTALGASNVDTITGFVVADDTIRVDNAVFAGLPTTGLLPASAFRIGAAAADADDRIIYNNANGALFHDADGVGGGAAVQFATLSAGLTMTNNDFVVV